MWTADAAVNVARIVPAVLRIEARRPAAWITFGAAFLVAAAAGLAASHAAAAALAVACGGLLAVAAIGQLPDDGGIPWPDGSTLLLVVRTLWPVAGGLLAAIWLVLRGGAGAGVAAVGVAATAALTAAVAAVFLRRGAIEGVAAGQSLAVIGLGAGTGLAVAVAGGSPAAQAAAIAGVWGVVFGSVVAGPTPDRQPDSGPTAPRHRRPVVGSGPAMATALAAMAACYFLAPQFAWWYALLASGWFVAFVVPAVTTARGPATATRLLRSAAGVPAVPGSHRRTVSLVLSTAGLWAWPAVVAAVLTGPEAIRVGGPVAALAALTLTATLTVMASVIVPAVAGPRSSGELTRAVVLSAVALGASAAVSWAARLPGAPGLPGLWPAIGP